MSRYLNLHVCPNCGHEAKKHTKTYPDNNSNNKNSGCSFALSVTTTKKTIANPAYESWQRSGYMASGMLMGSSNYNRPPAPESTIEVDDHEIEYCECTLLRSDVNSAIQLQAAVEIALSRFQKGSTKNLSLRKSTRKQITNIKKRMGK